MDNPNDPGGATKYGVTQRDLPDIPIQTLTVAQATAYYLANYVKPYYSQIESQAILDKLVDMGVLFGVGEAVEILQRVLAVPADGNFGPMTSEALNAAGPPVLGAYKTAFLQRSLALVQENPALGTFLNGWQRRISS